MYIPVKPKGTTIFIARLSVIQNFCLLWFGVNLLPVKLHEEELQIKIEFY